jgi:hypothetical protein
LIGGLTEDVAYDEEEDEIQLRTGRNEPTGIPNHVIRFYDVTYFHYFSSGPDEP